MSVEQRPLHQPLPPHSLSSCASPLLSSSEPERCSATSFLPWSSTVQLLSPSSTPTTSPGAAAVTTHELSTSANLRSHFPRASLFSPVRSHSIFLRLVSSSWCFSATTGVEPPRAACPAPCMKLAANGSLMCTSCTCSFINFENP
jgi:hypothetical protein